MIGSDLEGADPESRVASWAARGRSRSALPARRNQRVSGSCSFWNARGHWKITQYMYQQMPEQSGGGCSGI
jgi:hypothetical protein